MFTTYAPIATVANSSLEAIDVKVRVAIGFVKDVHI